MRVRHILRPVAAELTVKTTRIILSHRTALNGFDYSEHPIVTCTVSLCSADLDHMAGPCDKVSYLWLFLKRYSMPVKGHKGEVERK